jgi:hypothetical protein
MSAKTFCAIATVIFTLVALLHLTRIWMGWPAVIGAWSVPIVPTKNPILIAEAENRGMVRSNDRDLDTAPDPPRLTL